MDFEDTIYDVFASGATRLDQVRYLNLNKLFRYSVIVAVRINDGRVDVRRVRVTDKGDLFSVRFSCNAVVSKPERFNDIREEPTQGFPENGT
jgi:hypothetical protein